MTKFLDLNEIYSLLEQANQQWEKAINDYLEWTESGYLIIPVLAFTYSLNGVNSCWAEVLFHPIID